MQKILNDTFLTRWYVATFTLTCIAVIQSLAFPRWPKVEPLNEKLILLSLNDSDIKPLSIRKISATRSFELATSPTLVLSLPNGLELRILRARVRQRLNLNTNFITSKQPYLKIIDSKKDVQFPYSSTGYINNMPAVQTCYVPSYSHSDGFGISTDKLANLVDLSVSRSPATIPQLIGIHAKRSYGCTLISLASKSGKPISLILWYHILRLLPLEREEI